MGKSRRVVGVGEGLRRVLEVGEESRKDREELGNRRNTRRTRRRWRRRRRRRRWRKRWRSRRRRGKEEEEKGKKVLVAEVGGHAAEIEFDQLLCALGRVANVSGYGLEELGVPLTRAGTVDL